jgi:hypothetical protein
MKSISEIRQGIDKMRAKLNQAHTPRVNGVSGVWGKWGEEFGPLRE